MTILLLAVVILAIVYTTAYWKLHPLPVLVLGGIIFGVCSGFGFLPTLEMLSQGLGNTIKSIGLVIIAGTVIGTFMEQRGALKVIAQKIIALTGEKRASFAMSLIGYIVSICIFCDTAFIILIGLWKKISRITGLPLAVGAAALSLGLFASHCFIPPTPGPLAALSILGADFGKVLLFGSIAALAASLAGYIYATYAGKNEIIETTDESVQQEEQETTFKYHWSIAFLPVVLPLLLIGINSVASCYKNALPKAVPAFAACIGNPVAALTLGAFIAVFLIGKCSKTELTVNGIMGKSILEAANILIITAAGGAFGEVLKRIDFASFFPDKMEHMGVLALLVPLFAAALVKIAQGSSTLAILTAASITSPLLAPLGLTTPVMRALACCAVCCGSMMVSHTNDSYFWVVTRFSGMNVRQGLKLQTLGTLISGITAAIVLMIMAVCCI